MQPKMKIIIVGIMILLGVALFSYGAFLHSTDITTQVTDGSITITKSERALVKEASIGGVARDKSGQIKQTYAEGEKPPETCST